MLNFRLKSQKMCMYRQNPVSSCRTPTEIYNHNNNHDTNSRRPEIGFKSSVVGRNDAKESSPDDNTVLTAQAPPRGASAHARYLAASKISARQDGRTVLRTRLVFAVSPRSALSHSNLATCFRQSAKGFNAEICVRRS